MSEISPRPWRKKVFVDGSHNIVSGPDGLGFVCQYSHSNGEHRERAETDGSLITQAPELLERLKALDELSCALRGVARPETKANGGEA